MSIVYLSLGSNLDNKSQNLDSAIQRIKMDVGNILSVSQFHSFKPWGFESNNYFLNAVAMIQTQLSPYDLLNSLQIIEKDLGRIAKSIDENYEDRVIDIDILMYDDLIIHSPQLEIPHKWMHERDFVLIPFSEIAPNVIHPQLNKSIEELKNMLLSPKSQAEKLSVRRKKHDIPTKIFCQTLDLKDDLELIEAYKARHSREEVWSEILEGIKEIGILGMDIYIHKNRLFMIIETALDFKWDEAFAKLDTLPRQKEWEEYMSIFQQAEKGSSSSEKWKLMQRIFHLYE